MSRIGKMPVTAPKGVTLTVNGQDVAVKGPKGELSFRVPEDISVAMEDGAVVVKPRRDDPRTRALWGMSRAMIANKVKGVSDGFEKTLELHGVGYRAAMQGPNVALQLGFSHDVIFAPPKGVKIESSKPTEIKISGIDAQVVGQVAAEIRKFRPPEPYKAKGVRYQGETIRRKEGKKK